jgi:hypothetical protein
MRTRGDGSSDAGGPEHGSQPAGGVLSAAEPLVICLACGAKLTRIVDAIRINEQHAHVCVNPEGISYDIACYRDAPGCRELGAPEAFWSWFPGYAWCAAVCRSCGLHVGWGFVSAQDHFFGLIRARISLG